MEDVRFIYFIAESPNALLIRTLHSANQLSICGVVANWCDDLAQLIPGQTHRIMEKFVAKENDQLSQRTLQYKHQGGMMRQRETACVFIIIDFLNWRKRSISRKVGESAGFIRRVQLECTAKTIHDLNDCFEGRIGACREYTKPREDADSEIMAWFDGHTKKKLFKREILEAGLNAGGEGKEGRQYSEHQPLGRGRRKIVQRHVEAEQSAL